MRGSRTNIEVRHELPVTLDRRIVFNAILLVFLLAFSWGIFIYLASIAGFELVVFEGLLAVSVVVVASFVAVSWLEGRLRSQRKGSRGKELP
jgi:hypothetical protein